VDVVLAEVDVVLAVVDVVLAEVEVVLAEVEVVLAVVDVELEDVDVLGTIVEEVVEELVVVKVDTDVVEEIVVDSEVVLGIVVDALVVEVVGAVYVRPLPPPLINGLPEPGMITPSEVLYWVKLPLPGRTALRTWVFRSVTKLNCQLTAISGVSLLPVGGVEFTRANRK
jgi:hypothetical protein